VASDLADYLFPYTIEAYLPNSTFEPLRIGTNDRESAVLAAWELARGTTFFRVRVLETRSRIEVAVFAGMLEERPHRHVD
jgi:hypothetical protein